MGKAGCGTSHFATVFNGLAPPRCHESKSEVLAIPENKTAKTIDKDFGRSEGKATEHGEIYKHSFKTVTVRNVAFTAPYMQNGIFDYLMEVVEFYNKGGGADQGMTVPNQTLPNDSLKLTKMEMEHLLKFMEALTDTSGIVGIPDKLPVLKQSSNAKNRKIGNEY